MLSISISMSQQQQQQFVAADNNDDTSSQQSGSRNSKSTKKKGLIKGLGKSLKNVFPSSKRRRKKRRKKREDGNDDDDNSWVSYGSEASMSSKYDYRDFDENGNPTTREEQWALSGGGSDGNGSGKNNYKNNSNNRLPSSLALPKVEEGEDEDYDSDRHLGLGANSAHSAKERHTSGMNKMRKKFYTSPTKTKGDRGGGGGGGSISSSSLSSSQRGSPRGGGGSKSRKNKKTKGTATATTAAADPLSLVVLLVDPISLRFELLSLDFDLASHITGTTPNSSSNKNSSRNNNKSRNKNSKNNESEGGESPSSLKLTLTVQDVLNQITSESLTEETLKSNSTTKRPIGLIDRTEKVHYGTSNLDIACSSRPCPSRSTMSSGVTKSLCDLTYSGEPHRDVSVSYTHLTLPTKDGV